MTKEEVRKKVKELLKELNYLEKVEVLELIKRDIIQ